MIMQLCVEKEKDVAPDYIYSGFFSNQVEKTTQQMEKNSNWCIANCLRFSWNYRQFPVNLAREEKRVCQRSNPNWKQLCCETKVVKLSTVQVATVVFNGDKTGQKKRRQMFFWNTFDLVIMTRPTPKLSQLLTNLPSSSVLVQAASGSCLHSHHCTGASFVLFNFGEMEPYHQLRLPLLTVFLLKVIFLQGEPVSG